MSEIKFPCCVDCTNLSMKQRLDLQEAFEKLGAYVREDVGDYETLPYYGVDSHWETQWYNYVREFSDSKGESKVLAYTYEQVMTAAGIKVSDSSLSDNDTDTLGETEYSGSPSEETGCNQSTGAYNEFSVQKEYKIYHKGALILSGDKEYLMKVREVIEEALR